MAALSMQAVAMVTTQQSAYQSIAIQLAGELAGELAEKIRVRSAVRAALGEPNPFLRLDYSAARDKELTPLTHDCFGGDDECTAEEIALSEIHEIKIRVKNVLPDGRIQVCRELSLPSAGGYDWTCADSRHSDAKVLIKLGWNGKKRDASAAIDEESRPRLVLSVASYVN